MGVILFFDDSCIFGCDGLERRQGKPTWIPEATLEDPLAEGTYDFPLVWKDRNAGIYRGLYGAPIQTPDGGGTIPPLYAESPDGIHWTRPDLSDRNLFSGHRCVANQVFPADHHIAFGPAYHDPRDPDPSRRLKCYVDYKDHRALLVSPEDGMHWRIEREYLDVSSADYPTSMFFDRFRNRYVISGRVRQPDGRPIRRRPITFRDTEDFSELGPPRLAAHMDPNDPALCEFYGVFVFEYEDLYVGLLWRIHANATSNQRPGNGGILDNVLTYSYDAQLFNRGLYEPFIAPNELGEHGGGCIYTSTMFVDDDHVIRFYSGASKTEHFIDTSLTDAALMLHTLRLDGFYSMTSFSGKGRLRTCPFEVQGPDLRINVRAPYGSVRAALLDWHGQPLPGCSYDDCVAFKGDELFWTPQWKQGRGLSLCEPGQQALLELEIVCGELFGIRGDFRTSVRLDPPAE